MSKWRSNESLKKRHTWDLIACSPSSDKRNHVVLGFKLLQFLADPLTRLVGQFGVIYSPELCFIKLTLSSSTQTWLTAFAYAQIMSFVAASRSSSSSCAA